MWISSFRLRDDLETPFGTIALRMNNKQAKEFLVQQAAEQAALDNVSLSEIEQKMMRFTESDPAACDNPFEVNDEF
jgi:hypothetical protein